MALSPALVGYGAPLACGESDGAGRRLVLLCLIECEARLRKLVGNKACRAAQVAALHRCDRPITALAPMVGLSELPFRLTVRRLGGVTHTWTPMIDAGGYARCEEYRSEFNFDDRDSPCIAQLGGRDEADMRVAARLVASRHASVAGVEVNAGCPQRCARLGRYGAFLLSEPDKLVALVRAVAAGIADSGRAQVVPAIKLRMYNGDRQRTAALALRLVREAGAKMVTVHGRSRGQRNGDKADWETIRIVKCALTKLDVLVMANGDVASSRDVNLCLSYTRADGVMAARALLRDPTALSPHRPLRSSPHARLQAARLYLLYVRDLGAPPHAVRRHVAEILDKELRVAPPRCRQSIMAFRGNATDSPRAFNSHSPLANPIDALLSTIDEVSAEIRTSTCTLANVVAPCLPAK